MFKLTKTQRKDRDRLEAWLKNEPFRENSRDRNPQVPVLSIEEVLDSYIPSWDPGENGQFFTPLEMGRTLVSYLHIPPGSRVLEPCAGIGHLLYHLRGRDVTVDAYEADKTCVEVGQKLFPWANWTWAAPFDYLSIIEGQYDFVLANPPFGITWAMASGFEMSKGRAKRSEHVFMELVARALKPGGQAAVIAPYNLVDKMPRSLRGWFDERMALEANIRLPGEFKLTKISVHGFIFTRLEVEIPIEIEMVSISLPSKPPAVALPSGIQQLSMF